MLQFQTRLVNLFIIQFVNINFIKVTHAVVKILKSTLREMESNISVTFVFSPSSVGKFCSNARVPQQEYMINI